MKKFSLYRALLLANVLLTIAAVIVALAVFR